MKNIFYGLMALALLAGCSSEDMMPESPNEGLVELASVGIGEQTRGFVDNDGQYFFVSGDKVLMEASVNGSTISNTFTYDGAIWSQDAPSRNYKAIFVQDNPQILSVASYGGFATETYIADQSSMDNYAMASCLMADQSMGQIKFDGNVVTARLDHDNSDLAFKVYDGYDEKNTLVENTPVLKVIVDEDGSGADSKLLNFTAWNVGKSTDSYGIYTLFRVQLPAGCSILEAELSNVNETAGGLKTDIFFRASDGQPSNEINLEAGRRYSASYIYDMIKTVATVNVSISQFEGTPDQNITAGEGWSFDETTKTYTVFTAEGLQMVNQDIANNIATKGACNITLAADITLPDPASGGSNWVPIGNDTHPYNGTFDGAGHFITNLVVMGSDTDTHRAMIGYAGTGSIVRDVTLTEPVIKGGGQTGCIAGYSSGVVSNCHIRGGSIDAVSGYSIGGICGEFSGSGITGCTVNGGTIKGASRLGGICGRMANSKVHSCIVSGVTIQERTAVMGTSTGVGGIVGSVTGSTVTANISENNTLAAKMNLGAIYGLDEGNNTIEANTVTTCTLNGTEVDGKNN